MPIYGNVKKTVKFFINHNKFLKAVGSWRADCAAAQEDVQLLLLSFTREDKTTMAVTTLKQPPALILYSS